MSEQSKKPASKLALCLRSEREDDLEPRKVYRALPDRAALREGYLRVVDESGEDYLYPAGYFAPVRMRATVSARLFSEKAESGSAARRS